MLESILDSHNFKCGTLWNQIICRNEITLDLHIRYFFFKVFCLSRKPKKKKNPRSQPPPPTFFPQNLHIENGILYELSPNFFLDSAKIVGKLNR